MSGWDDDELLRHLDDALAGTVSDRARDDARAAFAWRTIDDDLMSLDHDSGLSHTMMVRSPATSAARTVGFCGEGLSLEIEIDGDALMGQVLPARVCQVSVVPSAGETRSVDTDESGFFSLTAPPAGPVRLIVAHDGSTQSTEWLTL